MVFGSLSARWIGQTEAAPSLISVQYFASSPTPTVSARANEQAARKVLTVLESGEYFGESGVLTYFNGGSKASATAPPVTEQFCLVARTAVEMLVLRRKHFNIIEKPVS